MTVKILHGDCIEMLRTLENDSVDYVVTSPPYWGLRDYGVDGQIGLEHSLGEHLEKMMDVFDEIRRVLKPTGTLWVNYGDCYATTPNGRSAADTKAAGGDNRTFRDKPFSTVGPIYESDPRSKERIGNHSTLSGKQHAHGNGRIRAGGYLKPKDLCMIPNRFAIAMQENGWWVRSEIIWAKPNPMPESVRDRPATAHEKIFLFSKSPRYFWNAEGARQNRTQDEDANGFRGGSYTGGKPGKRKQRGNYKMPDGWDTGPGAHGSFHKNGRQKGVKSDKQRGHSRRHAGFNDRWDLMTKEEQQVNGRNLRNYEPAPVQVWEIATQPFKGAHFATFPPELVRRCIVAGCPKGGLVLDPFGGAGTTGLVAARLECDAVLVELNEEYCQIARDRLRADMKEVQCNVKEKKADHGPLFRELEA
ncbi:MAG: site-specific DNA-methyltransferase [Gammaproteobacteria bacterium]|nr:site-specific DNA-methyltransferase [Gammaproteobacteria bacterium]